MLGIINPLNFNRLFQLMESLTNTADKTIDELITKVRDGGKLRCNLPHRGKINIEKPLPYLLVYRHKKPSDDPGTVRMLLSEASYLIIGEDDFEWYRELVFRLAEALSAEYKSYLVMEIWAGESGSHNFRIKGPAERIPTTIEVLKNRIQEMDRFYDLLEINCEVEDTLERHPAGSSPLLSKDELKNAGCLLMGLEIPPVYRSKNKELYPVFFRSFHNHLLEALHHSFFDFIRVQTTCGVDNYTALGRSTVDDNAREIDRKLCSIEHLFSFLWLVSPSNIQEIKHRFFESRYEKVLDYHYRLLPIDPDLLKRELFNLEIEKVEDPSLAFLFRDKREELDLMISMLNERGTRDFFYNSIRLYKGVNKDLKEQAREIMERLDETSGEEAGAMLNAEEFANLANREFEKLKEQDENFHCKLHLRKDVNVMMVAHGELYIPADYRMSKVEAEALIQHEVGTHVLTHYNGSQQVLRQFSYGLAGYDNLQEGLAVMSEYLVGGLTANRLRILAARVLAGAKLLEGADFREIFNMLHHEYGMGAERSFNVTSRIMQGGGFLKDIIYLEGLVALRKYLQEGGELKPLLMGKIAMRHVNVVKALQDRGLLKPPKILPTYFQNPETDERLQKIREGLPLYQMINA